MHGYTMKVEGKSDEKEKTNRKRDISCGMYLIRIDITLSDLMDDLQFSEG